MRFIIALLFLPQLLLAAAPSLLMVPVDQLFASGLLPEFENLHNHFREQGLHGKLTAGQVKAHLDALHGTGALKQAEYVSRLRKLTTFVKEWREGVPE